MKISELPQEIKELALLRQKEQDEDKFNPNENMSLSYAIYWENTKEGGEFWYQIDKGNFSVYYEKYGYPNNKPKETSNKIYEFTAVKPEKIDHINPSHYKQGNKETWEMMVDIWGVDAFIKHCEMTAFKYRMRLGNKAGQPIERDFEKALWYENKAKELRK